MQRDTTGLVLILIQTLLGIAGLMFIAYQNMSISRMILQLGELIAKTH